jgi:hypothetical protein
MNGGRLVNRLGALEAFVVRILVTFATRVDCHVRLPRRGVLTEIIYSVSGNKYPICNGYSES